MLRVLGMLVVLAGLIPACFAECEATPYAGLPVAAVRQPLVDPPPGAIAACPPLVAFDGRQYEYAAWGPWEIEAEALSEIGLASGSNHPLTAHEQRVYAIDGVPPATAIAMRPADGEDVAVLLVQGTSFTAELCQYLMGPRPPSCDQPAGEPASAKPKAP
jgi:hypothetical protein